MIVWVIMKRSAAGRKRTSDVWDHFELPVLDKDGNKRVRCTHCRESLTYILCRESLTYCVFCELLILIKFFVTSTNILSYVNSESKLGIEILESKHLIRNRFEISKESVMNIPMFTSKGFAPKYSL